MNILAIGCHPDDIEIGCAGTLAKFAMQGHNITICHVANGNMGHKVIQPDELVGIRLKEAQNSGGIIGAKVVTCGIDDLIVYDNKEQRDKIIDVIRATNPDLIITHSPNDYMPDHIAVSKLVFDASFTASLPHYITKETDISKITPIYYMDNLAGIGFNPTEYVDITDTIDKKIEMLECHISQLKWMRDHDNIDFADFVKTCSKFRGLQSGVSYAEGFTQCLVWPKIITKRLLP